MTELTITPKVADKTARFRGTVAAGEHVAVTIKGGAEWLGEDDGANLTLRVLDLVTGRTLAVFPRPQETMEEGETPDAWSAATEDENDLYCELNLNTTRMVAAARHMLRVPVLFVMGDTDDPRTLYFRDRYEVEFWPERIGDTVPYDLDKWPKQIDEWAELVAEWSTRLDAMKLSAVRTEAEGENPGKTTITLNDGTAQEDTVVEILDGQVTPEQMGAAIAAMGATKQDKLTFDAIPTEGSDNPVKSGGVHDAVKEVADAVTEHVGNTNIHVTATQKTAWTAKYDKPQDGIPKSDLAQAVKDSLGRADTAVQAHQSLDAYVNAAGYDSDAKEIHLKHDSTVVARIDATAFIKDGMISEAKIVGDNLVIVFNADAGKESISIPLTDIFNPANYYDKTAADNRFVQKETGKGLFSGSYNDLSDKPTIPAPVTIDPALSQTSENPVQNKVVTEALYTGFTEWVCDEISDGYEYRACEWTADTFGTGWYVTIRDQTSHRAMRWYAGGAVDAVGLETPSTDPIQIRLSRHLVTPTKTSQLVNDGAPNGGGTPYATTAQIPDMTGKADKVANATAGNLAALNAQGNLVDSGVKPSDFAAKADLPYAMVTLGEWEFSDGGTHTISAPYEEYGEWVYELDGQGYISDDKFSTEADALAALSLTFSTTEGQITATRPSLPGHLLDRAVNAVSVSGDTTLTLPALVNSGKARDFLVRLEISGSTVPTITFAAPTGETITYETDGDEFPVPDADGTWLYSFTETAAHKFAVSLKKVNTVAQGGS